MEHGSRQVWNKGECVSVCERESGLGVGVGVRIGGHLFVGAGA